MNNLHVLQYVAFLVQAAMVMYISICAIRSKRMSALVFSLYIAASVFLIIVIGNVTFN